MLHKKRVRWILIVLISFFMNACVNTNPPKESLSKKKEAELYVQMGVRYLEMNMLKDAQEKLERAVEVDATNSDAYNALGALYEKFKQFDKAENAYKKAMSFDQDNVSIKNNYGRFLCARGNYESGIKLLKNALALPLNNRKWFAYTHIGHCELLQGQKQLAEDNFRQALLENPRYLPALFEMQKISYHSRKFMSARAFLERYLEVSKHTSSTLWFAVQTERALGNKKMAEQYKGQLFSLFPASKEAQRLKKGMR